MFLCPACCVTSNATEGLASVKAIDLRRVIGNAIRYLVIFSSHFILHYRSYRYRFPEFLGRSKKFQLHPYLGLSRKFISGI